MATVHLTRFPGATTKTNITAAQTLATLVPATPCQSTQGLAFACTITPLNRTTGNPRRRHVAAESVDLIANHGLKIAKLRAQNPHHACSPPFRLTLLARHGCNAPSPFGPNSQRFPNWNVCLQRPVRTCVPRPKSVTVDGHDHLCTNRTPDSPSTPPRSMGSATALLRSF
jgi:hypothetical protein